MDSLDHDLITHLKRDGRASLSQLASVAGVTRATVRARLERLQRDGEIVGFSVVVRDDVERHAVRGIVLIEIEGQGTERVIESLDRLPGVLAVHTTHGRWDLVCEIGAPTLADLDAMLRALRQIDGVSNSETSLYLTTRRSSLVATTRKTLSNK